MIEMNSKQMIEEVLEGRSPASVVEGTWDKIRKEHPKFFKKLMKKEKVKGEFFDLREFIRDIQKYDLPPLRHAKDFSTRKPFKKYKINTSKLQSAAVAYNKEKDKVISALHDKENNSRISLKNYKMIYRKWLGS